MSTAPASGAAPRDDEDRDSATPSGATPPESGPKPTTTPTPVSKPVSKLVFDDPLDQQSPDDTDHGWGDQSSAGSSASDLARFLDEKPPHHI
ncbi:MULTISPECIES: hypothetical protein [unclassified Streptomyces]|uniref:hypothetical protein n=1 Tax=unclassified Streptomyces TaxID=2593676 RepID=UPI002E13D267|nr:hypothetical protein OG452_20665 [Streptomyces sp. NBC_01197]WSS49756.1 hypothetical protein OG708_14580 [Streptomyces sp. NBC_01180]